MKNRPFLAARTTLAIAALAALSAAAPEAQALGVGRLNVQSALGEGMRAEIDITSLSADEAASLAVRIASPDAYRAAGVDYNAVLAGAQAVVVRRPDGRAVLRLSSDRAVQEPFIELILEVNWASGRLVREFTLLFDPPSNRAAAPVMAAAPVSPVMAAAPLPAANDTAAPVRGPATRPVAPLALPRQPVPTAPAAAPGAVAALPAPKATPEARAATRQAARAAAAAAPPAAGGKSYPVRPGDTLYRVAGRTQPAGVSLDQMLVGLYRANPDAFIENNVNRLRAGAVLSVPSADEVLDVTPGDLRRLITAQSVDFSAYRNRLAQGAPQVQAQEPGRQAQGKVQASVDDRKQSAATSPDKLKLSGAAASVPTAPAAQPTGRQDTVARMAELTRNIEELKRLQQGAAAAQAPAAPPGLPATPAPPAMPPVTQAPAAAPAPAVLPAPVPTPVPAPAPSPAPLATSPPAASGVDLATAPTAAGPAAGPDVGKPTAPVALPPAAAPEVSLIDGLSSNPWLLPGAGALALLLAGYGAWRLRGRFTRSASETSFLESRMQPDSFFGASGGQHVDTRDASRAGASSMGYSLSQLDAIGDVDPVAEADVYLAYGRDLQAEEILKEAMRTTPERLSVRTKLLEVYSKRRDGKGFELLATQLSALTKGMGADWDRAQELGRQFDPDNQLYQQGGHPEEIILDGERVVIEPLGATTQPHSVMSAPTRPFEDSGLPQLGGAGLDLDLDLDLDEPDAGRAGRAHEATRPIAPSLQRPADSGLTFAADARSFDNPPPSRMAAAQRTGPAHLDTLSIDMDDDKGEATSPLDTVPGGDSTLHLSHYGASQPGSLVDTAPTTPGLLDDLALDSGDPLARKLELAEEFRQIGDVEGARDLLEEVVAKAGGTLRFKAQAMLDALV